MTPRTSLALSKQMARRKSIGGQFRATCSWWMAEPYCGHWRNRNWWHCQQRRQNMWLWHMQQRRLCGCNDFLETFSHHHKHPPHFLATINLQSHLLMVVNTTLIWSTSTSSTTSFAILSRLAASNSYIVQPTTKPLTHSQKPSRARKRSTLLTQWDCAVWGGVLRL